ncbi:DUF3822 family protein [Lacinutrix undariae]
MKLKPTETGQKTTQKSNNLTTNNNKALSIQINLSGLSFCIINQGDRNIEFLQDIPFGKKCTPFEVLEQLKSALDDNPIFKTDFDDVTIIYQNELSNLVPKELFNENNCADYLKFNAKILKSDFISFDILKTEDTVNVYVPLVNINNFIFERFGEFEYKHASTVFIDTTLQNTSETPSIHINVNANTFEILVTENSKILLYNTFEYTTKEDFIYYILFTVEQLKLDPETVKLLLSGQLLKDDTLYNIAYKYIRHVNFVTPKYPFTFTENLSITHQNYIILNSFN